MQILVRIPGQPATKRTEVLGRIQEEGSRDAWPGQPVLFLLAWLLIGNYETGIAQPWFIIVFAKLHEVCSEHFRVMSNLFCFALAACKLFKLRVSSRAFLSRAESPIKCSHLLKFSRSFLSRRPGAKM